MPIKITNSASYSGCSGLFRNCFAHNEGEGAANIVPCSEPLSSGERIAPLWQALPECFYYPEFSSPEFGGVACMRVVHIHIMLRFEGNEQLF